MRYFIWFNYDGTNYHGWQLQPNGNTVQAELQRGLTLLLREEITVTGAGRTDTGVHAREMAAHFDTEAVFDEAELTKKMNGVLPQDISVRKVEQVSPDMHARFSAKARTYHYYIHTRKNPFLRHFSLELHYQLDFPLMNEAGRILMEYDDFGAFCKAGSDVNFEITANRFLRNMVRAVVGTLIEVGRHRMTLDEFRQVIEGGRRTQAGESMPALALCLEKVEY